MKDLLPQTDDSVVNKNNGTPCQIATDPNLTLLHDGTRVTITGFERSICCVVRIAKAKDSAKTRSDALISAEVHAIDNDDRARIDTESDELGDPALISSVGATARGQTYQRLVGDRWVIDGSGTG